MRAKIHKKYIQKDVMDHNLSYYTCARFKFPSKGIKGRGGMVKLRIDRRISICSRYLTVASRINFLGQVARSVEQ